MLENCRWLLYASRFYGCHPHTIQEPSRTTVAAIARFRPLMLYSVVACGPMIVGCALQGIDRYTRGLFMILTTILSCVRHSDFERALVAARKFDDFLTKRRRRRRDDGPDERSVAVRRDAQWLALIGVHVAWALFGAYAKYATENKVPFLTIAIQSVTRAAFSIQVAKFCFLYDALRRRFCLVNRLCSGESLGTATLGTRRVTGKRRSNRHVQRVAVGGSYAHEGLTISHLQRLHRCLADATEYLSAHYSPQLFCWFACLLTDILMYIFFAIYTVNTAKRIILQGIVLAYLSVQIIAVSRVCHLTCDQANALARTVFSSETSASERSEFFTEAIELGIYLQAHPLRIRVFGLFDMDSQFPFLVFSVILMYVILASSIH